ncbi:MAG: hypothetical protein FWE85_02335 [Clostridiales bacterium]|nr:hypothetical protein [Clostridiales bacterium]
MNGSWYRWLLLGSLLGGAVGAGLQHSVAPRARSIRAHAGHATARFVEEAGDRISDFGRELGRKMR